MHSENLAWFHYLDLLLPPTASHRRALSFMHVLSPVCCPYICPAFAFCSITYTTLEANYLKFINKVSDREWKANFDFRLYNIFRFWVMPQFTLAGSRGIWVLKALFFSFFFFSHKSTSVETVFQGKKTSFVLTWLIL